MKIKNIPGATPISLDGLIPNITTQEELNEFEANNIASALLWLRDNKKIQKEILTATALFTLHLKMYGNVWEWAGKMRETQTVPGVPVESIQNELGVLLGNMEYWLKSKTFSVDEIAARFHHKLVWIHPFNNGNGRWSRMCADILLQAHGRSRFEWAGSQLTEQNDVREEYLKALRHADKTEDYKLLLDFARRAE